ncbi:glycosyltransferase family 2 protein [Candidatus Peregrinibacteria bacterium]|jgi:glycosyltransferase involved in cell wall biosynthesis|nr:glycosyltransferase family 2 protein [Candidatus Peregrinibacteria bacterium]MBT3598678.1 glycosyltransferase family 2 protein [Candidatus Peregrinibacteria bacterium]MBT4366985.1 glycosyltransferase family 2 protein [Candidatus Peregrinibacteria bacterium]MBT4586040.1 glycosyltransferase family 2 protein [Candidatus Peregrinibacteria bacterium]MBT6730454.1 glycosyltransferase family 2 protein [Candidatus Peregrinibacteria bacterium]
MISLVIPVYNEANQVEETINLATKTLNNIGEDFEIIAVNDGSSDTSAAILAGINNPKLTVLHHKINTGYSSSLKTGIRHSKGEIIAITDADGTYPVNELAGLFEHMKKTDADMVIGARTKQGAKIPLVRKPAKAIIALLANSLTGVKIPDNNSGLRIFRKDLCEQFWHLYPERFSFTITITLAALTNGYLVEFVPIDYYKRSGKSSMSSGFNGIKNFMNFIGLIIRIVTYFRPLRFFIWPSLLLLIGGIAIAISTIVTDRNISDAGLLLIVTGVQVGLFGLLADVIVRQSKVHIPHTKSTHQNDQ